MFAVNDVIVYGAQGVCRITGMEEKNVGGKKKQYYVLKPVSEDGSTTFVPVDNEIVCSKMRRLLTKEEIHKLIDAMGNESGQWVENETMRKECFRNILAQGDRMELMKMLKAIYVHKKEREAEGKRLHMTDERFFKDAEQILYSEFQYVLELDSKNALIDYIFNRIEK